MMEFQNDQSEALDQSKAPLNVKILNDDAEEDEDEMRQLETHQRRHKKHKLTCEGMDKSKSYLEKI